MAPHCLYVWAGTRAFQATLKDADVQQQVQLYVTDILCMTWPYLQCFYPALATIGSSEPDFSFWPFLGGWCAGPLKAVSDPELVSPHGSPTRYNHCVCLIRLSSRRKAPCFCQGIYHPSSAELFWEPAVALGLRLSSLQCGQHSQVWLSGGP